MLCHLKHTVIKLRFGLSSVDVLVGHFPAPIMLHAHSCFPPCTEEGSEVKINLFLWGECHESAKVKSDPSARSDFHPFFFCCSHHGIFDSSISLALMMGQFGPSFILT